MEVSSIRVASSLVMMGLATALLYSIWMCVPGVQHWICWIIQAQGSLTWGIAICSRVPKRNIQCLKMALVIVSVAPTTRLASCVYLG